MGRNFFARGDRGGVAQLILLPGAAFRTHRVRTLAWAVNAFLDQGFDAAAIPTNYSRSAAWLCNLPASVRIVDVLMSHARNEKWHARFPTAESCDVHASMSPGTAGRTVASFDRPERRASSATRRPPTNCCCHDRNCARTHSLGFSA